MPTTFKKRQLMYPDANAVPWPLNHRAYIRAVEADLRTEVPAETALVLPECQQQGRDIRTAEIVLTVAAAIRRKRLTLRWDEFDGWTCIRTRRPSEALIVGAHPLLAPDKVTDAVRALLAGQDRPVLADDQRRRLVSTVAPGFERQLAAYRNHIT